MIKITRYLQNLILLGKGTALLQRGMLKNRTNEGLLDRSSCQVRNKEQNSLHLLTFKLGVGGLVKGARYQPHQAHEHLSACLSICMFT
ncbi:hypothetical protein GYH30_045037 [Glycine max]|uniref:Uncharacterized protein n=1 Tax=Glycine max TaxID=3847 RepID=A0A0R0FQE4_SOYBN|nr:hypothetical protein GYH30_045037 [Glycine max]